MFLGKQLWLWGLSSKQLIGNCIYSITWTSQCAFLHNAPPFFFFFFFELLLHFVICWCFQRLECVWPLRATVTIPYTDMETSCRKHEVEHHHKIWICEQKPARSKKYLLKSDLTKPHPLWWCHIKLLQKWRYCSDVVDRWSHRPPGWRIALTAWWRFADRLPVWVHLHRWAQLTCDGLGSFLYGFMHVSFYS